MDGRRRGEERSGVKEEKEKSEVCSETTRYIGFCVKRERTRVRAKEGSFFPVERFILVGVFSVFMSACSP